MKSKKFWKWKNTDIIDEMLEKDASERILFLDGGIASESWLDDDVTPQIFKNELHSGTGNITVWINSPGGDCIAAAQIYNMLTEYKGKVTVKIDGIAASAASVIAMVGDEVLMSPVSMIMVHNPSTIAMGESNDFQKAIDMLNEVKESIINAYSIKTGLSRTKLSHLMDSETWMNANKAIELGFADGIIEKERTEDSDNMASVLFSCKAVNNALFNKLEAKYGKGKQTAAQQAGIPAPAVNEYSVSDITERLNYIKKHI